MEVASVKKALTVLQTVAQEREGLTTQEVSIRLGLPYATAHRLLTTLCSEGYLDFSSKHKIYRVGPKLLQLLGSFTQQAHLGRLIYPSLARLSAKTGETVHLGILRGHRVIYADTIPAPSSVGMYTPVGAMASLHSSGLGKALLSFAPDEEIHAILADYDFKVFTPYTIKSAEEMWQAISETRSRGYAVDWDESTVGVRCIASVIVNQARVVEAAMSISIPDGRLADQEMVRSYADLVCNACYNASQAFGTNIGIDPKLWYREVMRYL